MLTPEQRLIIAQAKLSSVKALLKKINHYANSASRNAFPEDADRQANYIGGCLMELEAPVQILSELIHTAKL